MANSILGILGGLGPLASMEFLHTIYDQAMVQCEQYMPRIILYSDPTFPDRTEAFLNGNEEPIFQQLVTSLHALQAAGASDIVICCFTMHYLLPRLPNSLHKHIISLLDIVFDALSNQYRSHLLLCTNGTRKLKLFENHPRWNELCDYIVLPDPGDQQAIHQAIYAIKAKTNIDMVVPFLVEILTKYGVSSYIAGCTEIHLLSNYYRQQSYAKTISCIDPLMIIAEGLTKEISCVQ